MIRLYPGEQQAFGADGHYGPNRRRLPSDKVAWTVEPPEIGDVTADGRFTARSFGGGHVVATYEGFPPAKAEVEVAIPFSPPPEPTPEPELSAISIVPL